MYNMRTVTNSHLFYHLTGFAPNIVVKLNIKTKMAPNVKTPRVVNALSFTL